MMECVLLSMDGVLADTYPLYRECVRRFIRETWKFEVSDDELDDTETMEKQVRAIALRHGFSLARLPVSDALDGMYASLAPNLVLDEGTRSFLASCMKAGVKILPVSRQDKVVTLLSLNALGLSVESSGLVAAEEAVKGEDLHRFLAMGLGLEVGDCLVFEASREGIRQAKQAGFMTCAVTSYVSLLDAQAADIVVSGLGAVGSFSTKGELSSILADLCGKGEAVRYGHSLIVPGKQLQDKNSMVGMALKAARSAWRHAYAPYSHFQVGAALVSAKTGLIYSGCNVENGSYGATICAERNAVLHAMAEEGELGIDLLVVVSDADPPAPPCAQCLQVLSEFSRPETEVHLFNMDGSSHQIYRFGELLPHPFVLGQS